MGSGLDVVSLVLLLPLLVLGSGAVLQLLVVAVHRSRNGADLLALLVHGAALAGVLVARGALGERDAVAVTPLLVLDPLGLAGLGLLIFAGLMVSALAIPWLRASGQPHGEFHALVALATLGAGTLAVTAHLAGVLLGIEVLGVALYGLIGYDRRDAVSAESALKYLIPAGASSAVLMFGIALVYAGTGGLGFADVLAGIRPPLHTASLPAAGLALILVGVGFKLALVPFHLWTPDVYQGAPPPVTALVASVSKGGVALALLRLVHGGGSSAAEVGGAIGAAGGAGAVGAAGGAGAAGAVGAAGGAGAVGAHGAAGVGGAAGAVSAGAAPALLVGLLAVLALLSMIAGNLLALRQDRLERLLAYSSIAHLGYLVVALLGDGERGALAMLVYLAAYVCTVIAAFGLLATIRPGPDGTTLAFTRGLLWRRPWVAGGLALCLLSLAGMPLTAGFTAKVFALQSAVGATRWALALVLALTSVLGLYYYLRVLIAFVATRDEGERSASRRSASAEAEFAREVDHEATGGHGTGVGGSAAFGGGAAAWSGHAALLLLLAAVVWLGAWPGPVLTIVERIVGLG